MWLFLSEFRKSIIFNANSSKIASMEKKKALFLDRDGVINVDNGYVFRPADFVFCDGIFEALRGFSALNYALFIVTNQSGIARGFYSENDFAILSEFMLGEFTKNGIKIERIYHCPHAPDANCECRKPRPGMILRASQEFGLNLGASILIGDKISDIKAGQNAGLKRCFLIGQDAEFKSALDVLNYVKKEKI